MKAINKHIREHLDYLNFKITELSSLREELQKKLVKIRSNQENERLRQKIITLDNLIEKILEATF